MKVLLILLLVSSGVAAQDGGVSGAWNINIETPQSPVYVSAKFETDGTKLTGTLSSEQGEFPVSGTFDNGKIEFVLKVDVEGGEFVVTFSGTLEKETLKGTADFGGRGSGAWTAARPK
jgi:hypothetical protein